MNKIKIPIECKSKIKLNESIQCTKGQKQMLVTINMNNRKAFTRPL